MDENTLSGKLKSRLGRNTFSVPSCDQAREFDIERDFCELLLLPKPGFVRSQGKEEKTMGNISFSSLFEPVFENVASVPVRKILLTGQAGAGKSTLCRRIGFEWAHGKLFPQFSHVFYIPLARLNDKKGLSSLAKWISIVCCGGEFRKEIKALLKDSEKLQKCLFILDGADEVESNAKVTAVLDDLLSFSNTIVSIRPDRINHAIASRAERQLELHGFSEDHIQQYLLRRLDNSGEVNRFLMFLHQRPVLPEFLRVPLNLSMLCDLWCLQENQDALQAFRNNFTLTGLYESFCLELIRRRYELTFAHGLPAVEAEYPELFAILEKIASTFTLGSAIAGEEVESIFLEEIEKINKLGKKKSIRQKKGFTFNDLMKVGLLRPENEKSLPGFTRYAFIHKAFQEYFAGRYHARCLCSGNQVEVKSATDFISEKKYDPNYTVVFCHISGILSGIQDKDKRAIQAFHDVLLTTRVDWVGLRHVILMIHVLEHYDKTLFVTEKKRRKIMEDIYAWFLASIRPVKTSQEFQKLIQEKLCEAFSQCAKVANECFHMLEARWYEIARDAQGDVKKAFVAVYLIPLVRILNDRSKNFLISALAAHQSENDFCEKVLSHVSWKGLRDFSQTTETLQEVESPVLVLDSLMRSRASTPFVRVGAIFALVEMTSENERDYAVSIISRNFSAKKDPCILIVASLAIAVLQNNRSPDLVTPVIDFVEKSDFGSEAGAMNLRVMLYALRKSESIMSILSKQDLCQKLGDLWENGRVHFSVVSELLFVLKRFSENIPELRELLFRVTQRVLEQPHAEKYPNKPDNAPEVTNMMRLVEERGLAIVEEITQTDCQIVSYSEEGSKETQIPREQFLLRARNLLTALQEFLAPLGLSSLGYQHFVALQKPRFAQSSKRDCAVSFFRERDQPAIRVMGFLPYLTVNQSKWCTYHSPGRDESFLKDVFIQDWGPQGEYFELNTGGRSLKIAKPKNVLLLPVRHAAKITLVQKDNLDRKTSELKEALRFLHTNEALDCCRYLDLSDNNLDNTDLGTLRRSGVLKNVQCLVLSHNKITEQGVSGFLDEAIRLKLSIRYLVLMDNRITFDTETLTTSSRTETLLFIDKVAKLGVVYLDLSLNYGVSDRKLGAKIKGSAEFAEFERYDVERWNERRKLWRFNFAAPAWDHKFVSLMEPGQIVAQEDAVFAILRSGVHWKLGIEYIDDFGQKRLVLADLIVDKKTKKIEIRCFLTTPECYLLENYEVLEKGIFKKREVLKNEKGVLAAIFKSQETQEFSSYGRFRNEVSKHDCAGWIVLILKKFDVHADISRIEAFISSMGKTFSASSHRSAKFNV